MALLDVISRVLKRRRERTGRRPGGGIGGLRLLARARCRGRLRLASTQCSGARAGQAALGADGVWRGFCPCCKRPIEATLGDRPRHPCEGCLPEAAGRYAYTAVLWGAKAEYCLGAMVLAKSLRQVGTKHDLVLLHTKEMPAAAVELMRSAGWMTREVDTIYGVPALYSNGEPRFECVFTKLQVLGLTEYEKVLLLDIDTLVLQNMDDLFQLPAPAAMARGPKHGYKHGDLIDGRFFFAGSSVQRSWGQRSGINAGVMLMAPSSDELEQMLQEVLDAKHPSHIRGNGPEQDYLSRYWASCWTHIGVEYNFQLHQLFYTLSPDYVHIGERSRFLAEPIGAGIKLMHYSGCLKPWSRFLDPQWADSAAAENDARFLNDMLRSFPGYWLWVLRDREMWASHAEKEGILLCPDGQLRRIDWKRYYRGGGQDGAALGDGSSISETTQAKALEAEVGWPLGEVVEVPEVAIRNSEQLVKQSLEQWGEAYAALSSQLGLSSSVGAASLAGLVQAAFAPPPSEAANGKDWDMPATAKAEGWRNCSGWWVDKPVSERASAVAGCIPERFVTLSVNCQAVLHVRGEAAVGVHAAVVPAGGAPAGLSNGDLVGFVDRAPAGVLVLVALVELAPDALLEALQALAGAGCGVPVSQPPAGCRALVAVGQKGVCAWHTTMAASDFAIATIPSESERPAWNANAGQ